MKPKKSAPGEMSAATSRPASTPEAQENYMINLAMKLVEKRLLEGTASSAETTHFLKLATSKNELEKTKLEEENKLLRAKTETLQNAKHSEEMYEKAIAAMKKYNGLGEDDENDIDGRCICPEHGCDDYFRITILCRVGREAHPELCA